ncbi:glycosyltransferase family 4 protein [Streptomyces sp. NBC_00452]|uniref:glycosyltransferase family 4 protein n=1 Tax=Streptomyces sp. NBC_00452 TaxID=2975746 RepID=UPI002254654F|nr:glycosyltransferase family 4 protein [Streptomyces sp. NBC_00452]MCX5060163.1 glycosyltransferase family 4 protein [Streptomyces sp. NBC_00452]
MRTKTVGEADPGTEKTARKLRIVLVAFACDPTRGSEPAIGWGWAETLARHGHTVEVLTHHEFDNVLHITRRVEDLGAVGERIKVHVVPPPAAPAWTGLLPGFLRGMAQEVKCYDGWQRRALAYARSHGLDAADLVHHVSYGSLQGGSALRRLGPPLVFGPVGGGQTAPHSHRRFMGAAYWQEALRTLVWVRCLSRRPSCRSTLRKAAVVLATNRDTERLARRLSRAVTHLMLADGIQESLIREPAQDQQTRPVRPPTVLWVGRLHPRKTPELALRAVAHLRSEIPEARLVILGDGPLRLPLERLAHRLGVSESVEFRGLLPREEVFRACDDADAFLMTSLRDSSSTQTLEAWARGLPVVHLGHHGISDFSAPGGAISVPLGNPADLPQRIAWALSGVLTERQTRHCMERAALSWARKHTWTAKAEIAERLYHAILPGER